jgi:hypothetical protein
MDEGGGGGGVKGGNCATRCERRVGCRWGGRPVHYVGLAWAEYGCCCCVVRHRGGGGGGVA